MDTSIERKKIRALAMLTAAIALIILLYMF